MANALVVHKDRFPQAQRISRAAQYVRMSTEYQQYSIENQAVVIAAYAQLHNLSIVRTYHLVTNLAVRRILIAGWGAIDFRFIHRATMRACGSLRRGQFSKSVPSPCGGNRHLTELRHNQTDPLPKKYLCQGT